MRCLFVDGVDDNAPFERSSEATCQYMDFPSGRSSLRLSGSWRYHLWQINTVLKCKNHRHQVRVLLLMSVPPGAEGQHGEGMSRYKSDTWTSVCRTLLPQQITGVVHMLLRACGDFPLSKIAKSTRKSSSGLIVTKVRQPEAVSLKTLRNGKDFDVACIPRLVVKKRKPR